MGSRIGFRRMFLTYIPIFIEIVAFFEKVLKFHYGGFHGVEIEPLKPKTWILKSVDLLGRVYTYRKMNV